MPIFFFKQKTAYEMRISDWSSDVCSSDLGYAVRYALAALKGVGERAMEELVAERRADGPFTSLSDLARRVDPRLLNKRQLETLTAGGAFDSIEDRKSTRLNSSH